MSPCIFEIGHVVRYGYDEQKRMLTGVIVTKRGGAIEIKRTDSGKPLITHIDWCTPLDRPIENWGGFRAGELVSIENHGSGHVEGAFIDPENDQLMLKIVYPDNSRVAVLEAMCSR